MKLAKILLLLAYLLTSSVVHPMPGVNSDLDLSHISLSGQDYASLHQELQLAIFTSMGSLAIYEIWWQRVVCKGWYVVIANNAKTVRVMLGISPLCMAAAFGKVEKIIALKLDEKYSLLEPDEHGLCAKHFAITAEQHGCMKILRIGMALVTKLQDVESLKGYVPVYDNVTMALLNCATEPNGSPEQLFEAIHAHDFNAVLEMLLEDPSLGFRCDMTYLERARLAGEKDEIYRLLLFCKQACFEYCALDGMTDYLENPNDYLSEFALCGANVNVYNEEGFALLHLAATDSDCLPVLQELLKYDDIKTDLHTKFMPDSSLRRLTALHVAAFFGAITCLETLLDDKYYDINVATDDCFGATPLHCAALYGHIDCVELLIIRGADVNAPDKLDQTPLLYAIFGDSIQAMQQLISGGADCEQVIDDMTPLHYAVGEGNWEAVMVLCHYGVSKDWKNKDNQTALDLAQHYGYQEIVDVLKQP